MPELLFAPASTLAELVDVSFVGIFYLLPEFLLEMRVRLLMGSPLWNAFFGPIVLSHFHVLPEVLWDQRKYT